MTSLRAGDYGPDHTLRTVVGMAGIRAGTTDEVAYFITRRNSNGQPLDSARSYREVGAAGVAGR
ncbi:hypothetical protein [Nocardia testacea]|uniref:hypothetical protein n=1 Tax=Nocardia testacea TaxID=248551 RepID=UPI0033E79383